MRYLAPVNDTLFFLEHCTSLKRLSDEGAVPDLSPDLVKSVLEEAGKFAGERIAPLNRIGDIEGTKFENGVVRTPKGWKETYQAWCAAGWQGLGAPPEYGGQGLPNIVNMACAEFWTAASMAWALGPLLTTAAIEAMHAHASEALKQKYFAKLVSGEWTGTMQLTEPQAGSDVGALTTRAVRQPDGSYRLKGQKIFITYGEHDMTDNIVHFVLARLPDAPAGTRGISLFLVPKFMVKDDGSLGQRNDLRAASVEHKLGIHASPTCVMVYGDHDGAVGYLVGEENKGLQCMFTMMNNARLGVGVQGVAIAERAMQQAFDYARERKQGQGADGKQTAIINHPDVKRMLLTMRALTSASRAISLKCADALDRAKFLKDASERKAAFEEGNLLTPIAKAFSTDAGIEVASLGVQIHGGMGFIEETGAAQHYRDSRISAIYEGTNGIQSIDLVTRKITQSGGETLKKMLKGFHATSAAVKASGENFGAAAARLDEALAALEQASRYLLETLGRQPNDALAGATPYQRLFGLVAGASYLAEAALAASKARAEGDSDPAHLARIEIARFFAENLLPAALGLAPVVMASAESVLNSEMALAG
ncbi:MAG TPA: acyl-CoA dehydrogenase [Xanthobacteraceae bacterium]|nr:acyl-CoA dehydrogenase [Xanthobacteraceae bacterium]